MAIKRLAENPGLSKFSIHKSGPRPSDAQVGMFSEIYLRGMEEDLNKIVIECDNRNVFSLAVIRPLVHGCEIMSLPKKQETLYRP